MNRNAALTGLAALLLAACGGDAQDGEAGADANRLAPPEEPIGEDFGNAAADDADARAAPPPEQRLQPELTAPVPVPPPVGRTAPPAQAPAKAERPRPTPPAEPPRQEPDPHAGHDMENMVHD